MQRFERTLAFPKESPCLDGHFPGNPVVPGVAILAELVDWAETQLGHRITGVINARFREPLLPGATWRILLEDSGADVVTVTAWGGDRIAMKVRLTVETH